jgi:hypothetical protein
MFTKKSKKSQTIPNVDEEDLIKESCRTCGVPIGQAGDGWDGECGNCADARYAREETDFE